MEKNKNIVYCMETIVDGLVKIGITSDDNFENRMGELERNGYANITGLNRAYAIKNDKAKEIEDDIKLKYSKQRVGNKELYAMNLDEGIEILTGYSGDQYFTKYGNTSKEELHKEMVRSVKERIRNNKDNECLLVGVYHLDSNGFKAKMKKTEEGELYLLKDSDINEEPKDSFKSSTNQRNYRIWTKMKEDNIFYNGKLKEDFLVANVSSASSIVLGRSDDGWETWMTKDGEKISNLRTEKKTRKRKK